MVKAKSTLPGMKRKCINVIIFWGSLSRGQNQIKKSRSLKISYENEANRDFFSSSDYYTHYSNNFYTISSKIAKHFIGGLSRSEEGGDFKGRSQSQ